MAQIETSQWSRWTLADKSGKPVVEFTTFISLDAQHEGRVVTNPVEEGSFSSYNKTQNPFTGKVTLGRQGTPSELQTTIDALKKLKEGTTLFSLVTPEYEYKNLTLESFSYTRKREDGVNVLYVELSLVEVREVTVQYTALAVKACKKKEHSSKKNTGKKQGGTSKNGAGAKTSETKPVKQSLLKKAGNGIKSVWSSLTGR